MVNRNDDERDPQPRRAVIYTRMARTNQDSEKVMAAEIAAIQKYAEQNHIEIADSYSDEGESGNDPDRPGLAGFDTVLIRKWDRLARNLVLFAAIVKALEASGIRVVAIIGNDLNRSGLEDLLALASKSDLERVDKLSTEPGNGVFNG